MNDQSDLRRSFASAFPALTPGIPFWRDEAARAALAREPSLQRAAQLLPSALDAPLFEGQDRVSNAWSSYKDHGYGHLFYALVRTLQPKRCIELGVLEGFSLLTTASALRDNGQGVVWGYGLFEDYPYRHARQAKVQSDIESLGLAMRARIERSDAHAVFDRVQWADMLHVDLSNDGDVVQEFFERWQVKVGMVMLFEGGGPQRDEVQWMLRYAKRPIAPVVEQLRAAHPAWTFTVLGPFPSLTIATRKTLMATPST